MINKTFPNQKDLQELEIKTSRVRIFLQERRGPISDQVLNEYLEKGDEVLQGLPPLPETSLLELKDPQDLSELFRSLELSPREGGWVCPIICDLGLKFWPTQEQIWIKDSVIRWDEKWLGDGELKTPELFAEILTSRGISLNFP